MSKSHDCALHAEVASSVASVQSIARTSVVFGCASAVITWLFGHSGIRVDIKIMPTYYVYGSLLHVCCDYNACLDPTVHTAAWLAHMPITIVATCQ